MLLKKKIYYKYLAAKRSRTEENSSINSTVYTNEIDSDELIEGILKK